jgi:hypothetical protein
MLIELALERRKKKTAKYGSQTKENSKFKLKMRLAPFWSTSPLFLWVCL